MKTYQLQTKFGNLQYQPINMLQVDLRVAKWKTQNKPPEVPKIRKKMTATEKGRMITLAMNRYGKHLNYLPTELKQEIKQEIEDTLPMVDNPHDKEYVQAKKKYADDVFDIHWLAVVEMGVVANAENEKILSMLVAYDNIMDERTDKEVKATDEYKQSTYRYKIYNAIISVSCVTAELVQSCLVALDRYYKGQPFLDVFDKRTEKKDDDIPVDAFRHSMDTLFISAGLYEHSKTLPIDERGMLAAMLLSNENMKMWHMEDAKKEATIKASSGVKNVLVEKRR